MCAILIRIMVMRGSFSWFRGSRMPASVSYELLPPVLRKTCQIPPITANYDMHPGMLDSEDPADRYGLHSAVCPPVCVTFPNAMTRAIQCPVEYSGEMILLILRMGTMFSTFLTYRITDGTWKQVLNILEEEIHLYIYNPSTPLLFYGNTRGQCRYHTQVPVLPPFLPPPPPRRAVYHLWYSLVGTLMDERAEQSKSLTASGASSATGSSTASGAPVSTVTMVSSTKWNNITAAGNVAVRTAALLVDDRSAEEAEDQQASSIPGNSS